MEDINRLQKSIADFASTTDEIETQFQESLDNGNLPHLVTFVNQVKTIQAESGDDEDGRGHMIADGLHRHRGLAASINHVAERLETAKSDREKGARSQKVAERLDHASDSCSNAIEEIELVKNVATGGAHFDKPPVSDKATVEESAENAKNELKQIQEAVDKAGTALK